MRMRAQQRYRYDQYDIVTHDYRLQGYISKYRDGCINDFARFFYDKLAIPKWNNLPVFGFYHVQDPAIMSRIATFNRDKEYLCYVYTGFDWNKEEEEELLRNVGIDITFICESLVDRSIEDKGKDKYDWLKRYATEKGLPFPASIVHKQPNIVIIDFVYKEDAIAFFKHHWNDKYSADDANRIKEYIEKNFDANGVSVRKEAK